MALISQIKIPTVDEAYDIQAKSLTGMTATVNELNYLSGTTSNVQTQLTERPIRSVVEELLSAKVDKTQTINEIPLQGNVVLTPDNIGAVSTDVFNSTVETLQEYTDQRVDALVGPNATESLDTIAELSAALRDNKDIIQVLEQAISDKVNVDAVYVKEEADLLFASADQGLMAENAVRSVSEHELNGYVLVDTGGTQSNVEVYAHPVYPTANTGLYKITVDDTGHVFEVLAVTKSDITALGIPGQDTTYTGGLGIEVDGTTINNTGVSSIASSGDGKISVTADNTTNNVTVYTHPSHTAYSGFYKITTNALGHVTAVSAVTKADITNLGIPAQDTTYTAASNGGLQLNNTAFSIAGQGVTTSHIADGNVTLAKLSSDIGTVAVQSDEPTEESVKLWIKI